MNNEAIITKLLVKANKRDGVILRKDFDALVPEEERESMKDYLEKRDIYVMDEEIEDIPDNYDINKIVPRKVIGSSTYNFLKEVSKYPRLTTIEEKRQMNIYRKGKEAKIVLDNASENELTDDEIIRLNNLVSEGIKARDTIVYSYHTFVLSIVNHYVRCGAKGNLEYEDLVQAGFNGLVAAIEEFDFTKEVKLNTFARYSIMNAVQEEIAQTRNAIAVSKTAQYNRMKVYNIINKFEIENGRQPDIPEIVKEMGITSEKKAKKKEASIRILLDSSKPTVNLDMKVTTDGESDTFDKFIPADTLSPLEVFMKKENNKELYKILNNSLNEKELFIIYHRHGINCDRSYTLEEIGQMLDLTRERIRQIESDIYAKLRNGQCAEILREMLPR